MGSTIFFDLVKDKTIDSFDPANVVTIMTSPICGALVPAAGGRTEMQGIGVQSYPFGWSTRSNFGGRLSAMLRYAGWDRIAIQGKADEPVWVDIRNRVCSGRRTADGAAEESVERRRNLFRSGYPAFAGSGGGPSMGSWPCQGCEMSCVPGLLGCVHP
jgi:hypothetical protein